MQTQVLVDEAVEALQSQIDDTAIIACSGGIDSTVAAILAHRAVGSLLHCVYVDTGLMRKNESEEVAEMFSDLGIELKVVDASERFLGHLVGVTDPEDKRKVIGEQFIRVFEDEQSGCGAKFLGQGRGTADARSRVFGVRGLWRVPRPCRTRAAARRLATRHHQGALLHCGAT